MLTCAMVAEFLDTACTEQGLIPLHTVERMRSAAAGALAAALVVAAAGCGGDESASPKTERGESTTAGPREAVHAPPPRVLAAGDRARVSAGQLRTTGFQAACVVNGQRATVQALPGQATSSHIVRFPGGGPQATVTKRADGSLVIRCDKGS